MPCIKIDKLLTVNRFWKCYEMMPITTSHIFCNIVNILTPKMGLQNNLTSYDK